MKETIEYDPEIESLITIDSPRLLLRGKKGDPALFLATAFFIMPQLDETLARSLQQYAETHAEAILAYLEKTEIKRK